MKARKTYMNKVSVVDCNNAEEEGSSLDTRYLKTASLIYLVLPFLFLFRKHKHLQSKILCKGCAFTSYTHLQPD